MIVRSLTFALLVLLVAQGVLLGEESPATGQAWKDVRTERVGELEVTLSNPVLVARRKGYLWFPTAMRLESGDLLAVMSNYHDDHVETSTAWLSWSTDGGLTWSQPADGFYSDAALRTPKGELLLPYYLRPRPGGGMGAPYQIVP